MSLPQLRLFVSSPGDVDTERKIAARVLTRLAGEYRERIVIDPYFWEDEPMRHQQTFQDQIPSTADFAVVLCFLWSRLGNPADRSRRPPVPQRHRLRGGERPRRLGPHRQAGPDDLLQSDSRPTAPDAPGGTRADAPPARSARRIHRPPLRGPRYQGDQGGVRHLP